ncbi:hypothetical protein RDWZM_002327 [Blomia tropicalis]|uniref:Calponin-homology (CH) domain-containing protein n=1 Tax=Blomia tropicalis TaxID=40697 RepID=A0A9Q0MFX5_BLOTA|nr:hypothetical protein RDWZM_002327 [Blomia tropicalis]
MAAKKRPQTFFISNDDNDINFNQNDTKFDDGIKFENNLKSFRQISEQYVDDFDENNACFNSVPDQLPKFFQSNQQFASSSPKQQSRMSPIMFERPVAFASNFIPFDHNSIMKRENDDEFCGKFPNEPINDFEEESTSKFKLPPRLLARLMKNNRKDEPNVQGTNSTRVPMQTMENLAAQPRLIRRETMILTNKKTNSKVVQNLKVSDFSNLDVCKTQERNGNSQKLDQTITIDTDEEEFRYTHWFNSVIQISFNIENLNVDFQRIINDCVISADVVMANESKQQPLKDGLSTIAYKEEKLLDILRTKANIFYDQNVKPVEDLLLSHLKIPRYHIRKDKNIHTDVGAKKYILELFLNYNPLWLKLAIECVFKTKIDGRSKPRNEIHSLMQVLAARLLSFKEVANQRGYKNITTYFLKEANVIVSKRHILYRFLLLIHFLDIAKRNRLIDHDPCLFRTSAEIKSTRDILVAFSREYITGVGDITKAVRNSGIQIEHIQNPIEEVNFRVDNLRTDLRDGVRLCRLAEIILQRNNILPLLQFPSNSITRKIHNNEIVFKCLANHFLSELPKSVTPRDICNGWRKPTLQFLDKCIELYNERLRMIELQHSISSIIKIQRFWRRVLESRHERQNYLKLRQSVIFVQTHWRGLVQTKVIRNEFLQLRMAIITIQQRFRANRLMKIQLNHYQSTLSAIIIIQKWFKSKMIMERQRNEYQLLRKAVITVQRRWRAKQATKRESELYQRKRFSVILIQKMARGMLARRRYAQMISMNEAAKIIQRRFRAYQLMKLQRKQFELILQSTILIQQKYRAYRLAHMERSRYLKLKQSTILIQKLVRGRIQRKQYEHFKSNVIFIQRHVRACIQSRRDRCSFFMLKQATIVIQKRWRLNQLMKHDRQSFLLIKKSTIIIQHAYRSYLERKRFIELRKTTQFVQQKWRANRHCRLEREEYIRKKAAAITIQRSWKQFVRMRNLVKATITIQQKWRAIRSMRQCQSEYVKLRQATLTIQQRWRAKQSCRIERARFWN